MASVLKKALADAARNALAPTCASLLTYRLNLRPILDKIIGNEMNVVHLEIDRERLFEQAIAFYKRSDGPGARHQRLSVTFKTEGHVEKGIDGSGLRREFYSIFFKECLLRKDMFVGRPRKQFPSNDMDIIRSGFFEALGRSIVASILNGDCGFPYLAPAVFYYLIGEDYSTFLDLAEVPDDDLKMLGQRLLAAKTNDEITDIIGDESVIDHIGWPVGRSVTMETRHALVQQLVQWSMIDKRKTSLDCLKRGLSYMNFLETTKFNPQLLPLLVHSAQYSVTSEYLQTKLIPLLESIKCDSAPEQAAQQSMIQYIRDITDEEATWLFQFITGLEDPPLVEETITIQVNTLDPTQTMPEATTCNNTLRVPIGNKGVENFKKSFRCALEHARSGFGQA